MSSRIIDSEIITAPSDGNVSSPENGGAINAAKASRSTHKPAVERNTALCSHLARRGREKRSNQRMRRTMNGKAFSKVFSPSFILSILFGNHKVRWPKIICNAASITTGSSTTCVMPPVGMGSEGINMKSKNKMAKLFSPKTRCISPKVLVSLVLSQLSSS